MARTRILNKGLGDVLDRTLGSGYDLENGFKVESVRGKLWLIFPEGGHKIPVTSVAQAKRISGYLAEKGKFK